MKGKALRRALETKDAVRVGGKREVPAIVDTTELISPETAREMLKKNARNRPINWRKVEQYAEIMKAGDWELHAQGIILDPEGNILTGQKRLWAVVYADCPVLMRVSRGNPASSARLIDRGTPQNARDLASRETGRKHSPQEVAICRAAWALSGITSPTVDELATMVETRSEMLEFLLGETKKTKKTREVLMVLAVLSESGQRARDLVGCTSVMAEKVAMALLPYSAKDLWGKGAAFGMAMQKVAVVVEAS